MSGTPAATMRATNSSASIVSELVVIVSMNEAAEYCRTKLVSDSAQANVVVESADLAELDRAPVSGHVSAQILVHELADMVGAVLTSWVKK